MNDQLKDIGDGFKETEVGLVPEDWEVMRLGEIARIRGEGIAPCEMPHLRYVGLEHLDSGKIRIRSWGLGGEVQSLKSLFYAGDILYGKLRPYLDKAAHAQWAGMCSTDILVIVPAEKISSCFLAYFIHIKPFLEYAIATTTGVNHPRTSWNALKHFLIPLPPLSEQCKMVYVLSLIQRSVEQQDKIIAAAQELKRSLMRHLFTFGPVPVDQIHRIHIKETELGPVPEQWKVVKLGDVAQIERGKFSQRPRNDPRYYGGEIPFIQTGDVSRSNGKISTYSQTLNRLGLSVSRVFPKGTIVLTIAANICDTGILEFDSAFPDSLVAIIPGQLLDRQFLLYYLGMQKPKMNDLAPRGTQKNINIQFLRPWPVLLPPLREQREIGRIISRIDQKLEVEENRKSSLQSLLQTMLHLLMAGRLRVNNLEIVADETIG